jgi:hypothetical protein
VNARSLILLLAFAACRGETPATAPPEPQTRVAFPVAGAKIPYIAGDGEGGFAVSFIDGNAFRFVTFRNGAWSQPRTIASDAKLLVNRADYPSIAVKGRRMAASWSTRNEHGSIVHTAHSFDGGERWNEAKILHPPEPSQYGFVSLSAEQDLVWLDGRKLPGGMEGAGDMQLYAAAETLLDPRVCDCCQTSLAVTSEGAVVAYRDRSADEIRDISIVRETASGWTQPKTLHADGWKIEGCPVNGPQIDADGKRVAVAWFTAANNQPRVNVAFSYDAGATFGAPVGVDNETTAGRADVALLADGSAYVTWLAQRGEQTILVARRVEPGGKLGVPLELGEASGFPRMAVSKENVAVVWSAGERVQFALIR